jgi:hypothetical protein
VYHDLEEEENEEKKKNGTLGGSYSFATGKGIFFTMNLNFLIFRQILHIKFLEMSVV